MVGLGTRLSVRDSYNADIESKQSAKRQRYQEDLEENRAAKRQRYQKDVDCPHRQQQQQKQQEHRYSIGTTRMAPMA